jgi:hypothetical protein
VNKNGLIETLSANQPRFDYDPISGECMGLLIEEPRTNLLSYSEQFDDASWSRYNFSLQPNVTTAPDGTTTADAFIENTTSNAYHYLQKTITKAASSITYTLSAFVQSKGGRRIGLRLQSGSTGAVSAFDLVSGTITTVAGLYGTGFSNASSSITQYPNNWYRIILTVTSDAATSLIAEYYLQNGASAVYTGNGTSGIYIWGAQLEAGAFPTSYIPTVASTVTRNPDLVTIEGTKFSSWYNQTEGTFLYNGTLPFVTNDPTVRVMYGVSNGFNFSNSIYATKSASSLGMNFIVIGNNVNQSPLGGSLPNMTSSKIKIASSVSPNNIYSCGDGRAAVKTSRPSAFIPTVTKLSLGREPWNSSPQNTIIGCISKFTYYPKALSPAELQYLTS